jgi:hypothetical protein
MSKSRTIHEMCSREAVKGERRSTIEANDIRILPIPMVSRTINIIATSKELDISTLSLPEIECGNGSHIAPSILQLYCNIDDIESRCQPDFW